MKKSFIILAGLLTLGGNFLSAQDDPPAARGVAVVRGGPASDPAALAARGRASGPPLPALQQKVVLTIAGTLPPAYPVDYTFSGDGPEFTIETPLPNPSGREELQETLRFQGTLKAEGDGFLLTYELLARAQIINPNAAANANRASPPNAAASAGNTAAPAAGSDPSTAASANTPRNPAARSNSGAPIRYRAFGLTGIVYIKFDQPLTLLTSGGKTLKLTLAKAN